MENISSKKDKDTPALKESLMPSGQVLANDGKSRSLHVQGDDDERTSGSRLLGKKSETQGSSLSAAFVHSPDLPEHQSLQLLQ